MKEEIEKRIAELEAIIDTPYLDSAIKKRAEEKLEYLKELYDNLYGY